MTRKEMRDFAAGQIKWYTEMVDELKERNQRITERLIQTRKADKEMAAWALENKPGDEWTVKTYGPGYKGEETRKLLNERARNYREIKSYTARIAQYEREVIKYTDPEQEPSEAPQSASKTLTWSEFRALALKNYNNGGDAVVECWTEADFDEYVQEFGPMTEAAALDMFGTADDVYRDRSTDGTRQAPTSEPAVTESPALYDDTDGFNRDRPEWRPGGFRWEAPGMTISDFVR